MHGNMISAEFPDTDGWGTSLQDTLPISNILKVIHAPYPYRFVAEMKICNLHFIGLFGEHFAKDIDSGRTVIEPIRGMAVEIKKVEEDDSLFMNLVSFTDIRSLQLFMEILYGIFKFQTKRDLQLTVFGIDKEHHEPSDPKTRTPWRLNRIRDLKEELEELQREEAAASGKDIGKISQEALDLVRAGKPIDAVKHMRMKMGWGLREAHDYVEKLKTQR